MGLRRLLLATVLGMVLGAQHGLAEPWLSTRYAQNCAACHGPGRKNLAPMERRCTLSCQGCHTNPNGGGLRNLYGKWNEDRWLHSFRSDQLRHALAVAPTQKQAYGVRTFADSQDGEVDGKKTGDGDKLKKSASDGEKAGEKKSTRRLAHEGPGKDGFKLVETNAASPNEDHYKRDGLEFTNSKSKEEFLYQVPEGDPYRVMDQTKTNAGGDIRWQWVRARTAVTDDAGTTTTSNQWGSFLMDADFNMEWRPINKYLHLVYEARIEGSPADHMHYEDFLLKANTRSLYAMADNLPYNTFVMAGYYRPLFGNFVPDHYALAQELTTYATTGQITNYNMLFSAVSIGTAPNVPYLNLHLINKDYSKRTSEKDDNTKGFAANAGLRFVTLGASLNYSYWSTTDKRGAGQPVTKVEMHSLGGAGRLGPVVAGLDLVSLKRDVDTQDFRKSAVITLDTYTQIWREQYMTLMLSRSNTTSTMLPGAVSQLKAGARSFWLPGFETSLVFSLNNEQAQKTEKLVASTTKSTAVEGQFHVYF